MYIYDSRMMFFSFGEIGYFFCSNGILVKKLECSLKYFISVDLLNFVVLRQSFIEGVVYLFGDKNIEQVMKEKVCEYVLENVWILKLDLF